jgi:hypothetical protein
MGVIVAAVLSYRMMDRTNKTVEQLIDHGFTWGADLFVYENQAKPELHKMRPTITDYSMYVNRHTGDNLRMTGGFNFICDHLDKLGSHKGVWLCTNDFDIEQAPPDLPDYFESVLAERPDVGWLHPAKTPVPGYAYPWMDPQGSGGLRPTWMTDFICPLISWDDLTRIRESFHGHQYWFDPAFYRGWGIDYETCYLLRQGGSQVVVDDNVVISHAASETYRSGQAPESQQQFYDKALVEMRQRLAQKYGPDWLQKFQKGC